jgi:hypothetical protein
MPQARARSFTVDKAMFVSVLPLLNVYLGFVIQSRLALR